MATFCSVVQGTNRHSIMQFSAVCSSVWYMAARTFSGPRLSSAIGVITPRLVRVSRGRMPFSSTLYRSESWSEWQWSAPVGETA